MPWKGPSVVGETVCARCGRSSPADASFCASCGARLGRVAAPQEERKLVSILFVDLEGFTASSEAADPEDVRDALARYHTVARERIEAYGGTVEKFIGDAVMAVFGRRWRTATTPSGQCVRGSASSRRWRS